MRTAARGARSLGLLALLSFAWADHGAPAPQLAGVALCIELSSVQVRLEAAPLPPDVTRRVREAVFRELREVLSTRGVPYKTDCSSTQGYVLLSVYARFLDPKTYLGFPAASYTYVGSAQVGAFVTDAGSETTLPSVRYAGSASDIFQARTVPALEARLTTVGRVQAQTLAVTWAEANAVALSGYLLFAALGLSLASLRVLPLLIR